MGACKGVCGGTNKCANCTCQSGTNSVGTCKGTCGGKNDGSCGCKAQAKEANKSACGCSGK